MALFEETRTLDRSQLLVFHLARHFNAMPNMSINVQRMVPELDRNGNSARLIQTRPHRRTKAVQESRHAALVPKTWLTKLLSAVCCLLPLVAYHSAYNY